MRSEATERSEPLEAVLEALLERLRSMPLCSASCDLACLGLYSLRRRRLTGVTAFVSTSSTSSTVIFGMSLRLFFSPSLSSLFVSCAFSVLELTWLLLRLPPYEGLSESPVPSFESVPVSGFTWLLPRRLPPFERSDASSPVEGFASRAKQPLSNGKERCLLR